MLYLFWDLWTQENDERGSMPPPLEEKYSARECLIELFGYAKGVTSEDWPQLLPTEDAMQARFIDELSCFPNAKFDLAVESVLHSTEDDYLARACARYLRGRGANTEIQKYVQTRLAGADENRRKELERLLMPDER